MVEAVNPDLKGTAVAPAEAETGDLPLLRRAAQAAPDDADAQFRLGEALAKSGRERDAVVALQKAIRLQPDHIAALVRLGSLLIDLGNEPAGKAALQAALQRTPADCKKLFQLGNMLRAVARDAEAIAAFEAAIRVGPETASAHYNRGICLRKLDRLDEAAAAYQRAVEINPKHAGAHNNLGNCLRHLKKYADAERALRRAVELTPEAFGPHYGLGRVLHKRHRPGEAVVAFRRALRLNPDHAESHMRLGVVLQEIGQLEPAKESYRRTVQIRPDYAAAHGMLSQLDREPLDRAQLDHLESLIASGKCSPMDLQHLHFALAHRYEQVGEFELAFDHLATGGRLKRAEMRFSIEEEVRYFRAMKRTFNTDFFARHAMPGNPSRLPIFIVGMPRSGTTLIEQILASHSLVYGAGEISTLADQLRPVLMGVLSKDADVAARAVSPETLQDAAQGYLTQVRRLSPQSPRIVDKFLTNFIHVGLIRLMLPNAKIIHARRHPIDNCLSAFRKLFAGGLAFTYDLSELGTYYAGYAQMMRHWHDVLPGFVFDVQYEEMIEDQRGVTERMLAFCELDWEDACLQFHETQRSVRTASVAQVRRPIYQSSSGAWKRYGERLRPLIDALGDEVDPSDLDELKRAGS